MKPASRFTTALAWFFALWTLMAAAAIWYLIAAPTPPQPRVLLDGDRAAGLSEQIHRWLQLADLNFRGAYPWLLFAPYVVWLAARFHLERGRLRISVPLHLGACALFALVAYALNTRIAQKDGGTIIVSGRSEGMPFPWQLLTNSAAFGGKTFSSESRFNFQSSTAFVAGVSVQGRGAGGGGFPPERLNTFSENISNPPGALPKMTGSFARSSGGTSASATFSAEPYSALLFPHLLNVLAYAAIVGIAQGVHFQRRFRERERRAVLLESHLARARLHSLQAQLHPHFLFNALNAVATLLRRDPRLAGEALSSFSDLLRLVLSRSDKQEIPLRDDLEFVERYADIQRIRLGDRFRFELDIAPDTLACLVPALLLQPLVENALRHGIEPSAHPGTVRVSAREHHDCLALCVEDNGIGLPDGTVQPAGTGIGLANLRARLETLYGSRQKLELVPRPEGGILVRIEIPVRRETAPAPQPA